VRYPADHKHRVRAQIVRAAARRFRGRGGEGVAIADLMRELKLTHGGFYRHFRGKEELFNEALIASIEHLQAKMIEIAEAAGHERAAAAIVRRYLSLEHCANPSEGCPLAALSTEIARHPKSTRAAFDEILRSHLAPIGRFMPGRTKLEREQTAIVVFAGMAGVLNVARAVADDTLRDAILADGRAFYLKALGQKRE
jgi:TetR/AcrR family transcriptional regulator, transcriptional repressor for nem operon